MHPFARHIQATLESTLLAFPAKDRDDIYAISLWVQEEDDEPPRPAVTIGYNTERNVAARTPDAWDADEARWKLRVLAAERAGLDRLSRARSGGRAPARSLDRR